MREAKVLMLAIMMIIISLLPILTMTFIFRNFAALSGGEKFGFSFLSLLFIIAVGIFYEQFVKNEI